MSRSSLATAPACGQRAISSCVNDASPLRDGNLIVPTEDLQEILHRLDLCSRISCGPDLCPCSLLLPDLFSGILHRPYLCPPVMDGPDVSVFLHGPKRCPGICLSWCRGILRNLSWSILNGLYGSDPCLRIFQGIRWWLSIFRLILISRLSGGSHFVAGRRILCGRWQSLSIGGRLNCWRRLIGARLKRRFVD